jgi:DNA-binding NarL/FixJ family response regulator
VRVLVVENTASIRTRLVALLSAIPGVAGVAEARGTSDGLEALRAQEHHVVVLDLHLADGIGLAFVAQVKREFPGALLFVMTNEATEHHRRRIMADGADAFFDKSRDFDAMAELVGRAAARAAAGES